MSLHYDHDYQALNVVALYVDWTSASVMQKSSMRLKELLV